MNAPTISVLDLNVKAITCMAMGDHQGCTVQLETALREYRRSYEERARPVAVQAAPEGSLQVKSVTLPLAVPHRKVAGSQFAGNMLTLFEKAFVVVDHNPEPRQESIVPAVLLYNMGLSFHLEGLRCGTSKAMLQANEFYRYSMSLAERGNLRPSPLMAALANNMAHISSCFFHEANLRTSMLILQNLLHDPVSLQTMEEEEMDLFTMNWIFYIEYYHIAMAAAA